MLRSAAFLAALWLASMAATAEDRHVTIGVRVDAGPFAWRDDRTDSYRGYLVDLCREATTRAGYTFDERPVTAAQRVGILNGSIEVEVEKGFWTLDLLCDPTTISLRRLDALGVLGSEVLAFTQLVFVANGSFVELKDRKPRPQAEVAVGPITCPEGGDPPGDVFVAGYIEGTTARNAVEREARVAKGNRLCLWPAQSHGDAVAALCRGEIDFYFGDLDIIEFYRRQAADALGRDCAAIVPPERVLTYEPYALLVSNAHPGFRPRFIAALYELFSDGTAERRFASHFPEASKSTALSLLFRINSVPGLRKD